MNLLSSKKWKNNKYIGIADNYKNLYDNNYDICILDENKKILNKYKLTETRLYLGSIICPNDNIFIFVHYKYSDKLIATLYIEFYEINDDFKISKIKEFNIESQNFSCGETTGRVCKINDELFTVVWGDRTNYDYYNFVAFKKTKYENPIRGETRNEVCGSDTTVVVNGKVEDFAIHTAWFPSICGEPVKTEQLSYNININSCYFFDTTLILESNVIAYNNKFISIKINNYVDFENKQGYIYIDQKIELPFDHRFDYNEIDSYIISFQNNNNNEYICELRINLESKLNVLYIDYFNINLLINITTNKIINISEKNRNTDILFFF